MQQGPDKHRDTFTKDHQTLGFCRCCLFETKLRFSLYQDNKITPAALSSLPVSPWQSCRVRRPAGERGQNWNRIQERDVVWCDVGQPYWPRPPVYIECKTHSALWVIGDKLQDLPESESNTHPSTSTNQTHLCSGGKKQYKVKAVKSAYHRVCLLIFLLNLSNREDKKWHFYGLVFKRLILLLSTNRTRHQFRKTQIQQQATDFSFVRFVRCISDYLKRDASAKKHLGSRYNHKERRGEAHHPSTATWLFASLLLREVKTAQCSERTHYLIIWLCYHQKICILALQTIAGRCRSFAVE